MVGGKGSFEDIHLGALRGVWAYGWVEGACGILGGCIVGCRGRSED